MMSGPATDWKTTVAFRALMEASSRITGGLFVLGALLMPALSVGQLPPEIMVDRYLLKAEQSIREGDCAGSRDAMETMERVLSLQEKHGLKPAPGRPFQVREGVARVGFSGASTRVPGAVSATEGTPSRALYRGLGVDEQGRG